MVFEKMSMFHWSHSKYLWKRVIQFAKSLHSLNHLELPIVGVDTDYADEIQWVDRTDLKIQEILDWKQQNLIL